MAAPLTDQDRAAIDKALADLKVAREMITRAKTAGLDVSVAEAQVNEYEARLRALRSAFFPTGSKS